MLTRRLPRLTLAFKPLSITHVPSLTLKTTSISNNQQESFENVNLNLPIVRKPSVFDQVKEKLGFQGSFRYSQTVMRRSGLRLYLCLEQQVEYEKFFKLCKLEDVFANWCLITFLHVWLISVRLADESRSGLFVRRELVDVMWKDITERTTKLRVRGEIKNQSLLDLYDIFNGCLFGFDEGLLSNDAGLAASLWRHFLGMEDANDFSMLVTLCDYVRKNVHHMEKIPEKDLLRHGVVTFVKFDQESIDHEIEKIKILRKIEVD
jgi:cytochrome b pre-mRNA-processing protein 3